MKKITLLFCLFSMAISLNAQTTYTDTETVDIAGTDSWDVELDSDNITFSVLLDGLSSTSPCTSPTLELIGLGWDVTQQTIGASWLNEMVISFDANQDGTPEIYLTPSATDNNGGNSPESNSSGGILDLVGAGVGYQLIANATSGSINLEFFEGYDDVADAIDGMFIAPSTITLQYRLTCNTLGIEDFKALDSVTMYPSIAEDFVTFSNPQSIVIEQVEIYTLNGKLVQLIDLSDMNTERLIDVSTLATGNYFVKIKSDTGYTTKRLIKK